MIKKIAKFTFAGIVGSMLVASALQARTIRWRLAMTWPSTLTPLASPPIKMAQMVKKMSNGRLILI